MPDQPAIQFALLQVLKNPAHEPRIHKPYLYDQVRQKMPTDIPDDDAITEAIWALVARRLAWIKFDQGGQTFWRVRLTEAGVAAAAGSLLNPDVPTMYLREIRQEVPNIDPLILDYLADALDTYGANAYRPSIIMLGVASEAAVIDMVRSFIAALNRSNKTKEASALHRILDAPQTKTAYLMDETRKRVDATSANLPQQIKTDLRSALDFISDVLRQDRNNAGHPSGTQYSRSAVQDRFLVSRHMSRSCTS